MHLVKNGHATVAGRRRTDRQPREQGLLGWAMEALVNLAGGAWVGAARVQPRRMKVLETLSMGPKRQLVLVCCDGEKYLVGTGPESVQTIVRIEPRASGLSVVPAEWGERP